MARHGLWQWHRLRSRPCSDAWWRDDEEGIRARSRAHDVLLSGYEYRHIFPVYRQVEMCAYRYLRRKLGVVRLGAYAEMCRIIAHRASGNFGVTLNAIPAVGIALGGGRNRQLVLDGRQVRLRRSHYKTLQRYERLKAARAARLAREQAEEYARREAFDRKHAPRWRELWEAEQDVRAINSSIRRAKAAIKGALQ